MALDGIIGRKLGMTQVYTPEGRLVPVTVIQAGPCTVVTTRRAERDGYVAAQLGFSPAKPQRVSKPLAGQFIKAGTGAFPFARVRFAEESRPRRIEVKVATSSSGTARHVTGVSKGRGTAASSSLASPVPATQERMSPSGTAADRTVSYPGRLLKGKRWRRYGRRITTRTSGGAVRADDNLCCARRRSARATAPSSCTAAEASASLAEEPYTPVGPSAAEDRRGAGRRRYRRTRARACLIWCEPACLASLGHGGTKTHGFGGLVARIRAQKVPGRACGSSRSPLWAGGGTSSPAAGLLHLFPILRDSRRCVPRAGAPADNALFVVDRIRFPNEDEADSRLPSGPRRRASVSSSRVRRSDRARRGNLPT